LRMTTVVGVLDLLLALALVICSFEPIRSAIGRSTGLWHACMPVAGGHDHEHWSPLLVAIGILPVAVGFVSGHFAPPGRARLVAKVGASALSIIVIALVVFPTGSCVT